MTVAPSPTSPYCTPVTASPLGRPGTGGFLWWLPLLVAAIAGAVAFALTDARALEYESRAALLAPEAGPLSPEALVAVVASDPVLDATIKDLNLDTTVTALREQITVDNTGVVINVLARAASAADASRLARAVVNEARDPRVTQDGNLLVIHRQPSLPSSPLSDDTPRNTAGAVAGGLLVGVLLAFVLAGRERASSHRLQLEALTGWPVLGAIPRPGTDAGDPTAAYDHLQRAVESQRWERSFRTLLVTSIEDGDGVSDVAMHLAIASAQAGVNTTLVDADLDEPSLHRLLGLNNDPGLADSLRPEPTQISFIDPLGPRFQPLAVRIPTSTGTQEAPFSDRLQIVTAGATHDEDPAALLHGPRLGEVLRQLAGEVPLVIVIGPSLEDRAAVTALDYHCDATLMVVNALSGDPDQVQNAARTIGQRAPGVIGAVLTRVPDGTSTLSTPTPTPPPPGSPIEAATPGHSLPRNPEAPGGAGLAKERPLGSRPRSITPPSITPRSMAPRSITPRSITPRSLHPRRAGLDVHPRAIRPRSDPGGAPPARKARPQGPRPMPWQQN